MADLLQYFRFFVTHDEVYCPIALKFFVTFCCQLPNWQSSTKLEHSHILQKYRVPMHRLKRLFGCMSRPKASDTGALNVGHGDKSGPAHQTSGLALHVIGEGPS